MWKDNLMTFIPERFNFGKFKWGGLRKKHAVISYNLKTEENHDNLRRDGRSVAGPSGCIDTDFLPAVRQLSTTQAP
jgi:hypothetical protein